MPTSYAHGSVQLGDLTLPADGDPRVAASVNLPLSQLADGIGYMAATLAVFAKFPILTTSGLTVPNGATHALVRGWGCGGNGGAGTDGGTIVGGYGTTTSGGGGGGGAPEVSKMIEVIGGTNLSAFVGSSGSDSLLRLTSDLSLLWRGARGGNGFNAGTGTSFNTTTALRQYAYALGGRTVLSDPFGVESYAGFTSPEVFAHRNDALQGGGVGVCGHLLFIKGEGTGSILGGGGSSPQGFAGGNRGAGGTTISPIFGGGPGGGGGAGPGGNGAFGGSGSDAVATGTPAHAEAGSSAGANSGAGGGGGGSSGGYGSPGSSSGLGGAGGFGGSGYIEIYFFKRA